MPVGLLYDGLEANLARSGREVVDQALPRRSLHRGPSHRGLASATLVTELRRSRWEPRSRCTTGIAQVVPKGRTISTERIAGRAGNGEGEYCDKESNTVSMRPKASMNGPLDGWRALEVADSVSASFCAKILSDLGAEVLKIEPPVGHGSRRSFPRHRAEESCHFLYLNTGKESVVVPDDADGD